MSKGAIGRLSKLTPMSVNWESLPGTSGNSFTASDVAAALSSRFGLSYGAQQVGWLLTGDSRAETKLRLEVMSILGRECKYQGREYSTQVLSRLARSAIGEFCCLAKCEECRGSGKVIALAKPDLITRDVKGRKPNVQVRHYVTCPGCKGHGVTRWSIRRAAKEAGLNDRTYGRKYRDLHDLGYQSLVSWLLELTAHLKTHLNFT